MSPIFKPDGTLQQFFLYIISNNSMTLYIGVTNDLHNRTMHHMIGEGSSFTRRYHFDRLVYYESFMDIREAIAREKAIKGWKRERKIALVKTLNHKWENLLPSLGDRR